MNLGGDRPGIAPVDRFYDPNGNLKQISEITGSGLVIRERFRYDAWNRLVFWERPITGNTYRGTYSYNGLHWKTRELTETVYLAATTSNTRLAFYSPQWQQLLEVDDVSSNGTFDRAEQQFWGLRGVDDAILRRLDSTNDGQFNGVGDDAYHQITDSSFSVVAHLSLDGKLRQWMSYDPYGRMKIIHPADFNGDGTVAQTDSDLFVQAWTAQRSTADLDGDGSVEQDDHDLYFTFWDESFEFGFTQPRIGFAGYVHDMWSGRLLGRARWYTPQDGRWLTPDPAGYVDGLNVYQFVRGNPLGLVDPTGLDSTWLTGVLGIRDTWVGNYIDNSYEGAGSLLSGEPYEGGYLNNLGQGFSEVGSRVAGNPWADDAASQMAIANATSHSALQEFKDGNVASAASIMAHGASDLQAVNTANADTGQLATTAAALTASGVPLSPIATPIANGIGNAAMASAFRGGVASYLPGSVLRGTFAATGGHISRGASAAAASGAAEAAGAELAAAVKPNTAAGAGTAGKYSVGAYNDMKGAVPGLDAHHVGQQKPMKALVPGYDPATAPTILVPKVGHTIRGPRGIVSRSVEGLNSGRDVIARDIRELRRVYPDVPNSQLQQLIQMNKDLYPTLR